MKGVREYVHISLLYFCLVTIAIFSTSFLTGCSDNKSYSEKYSFFGDSHIQNWDLEYHFGNFNVSNFGINGLDIRGLINQLSSHNSNAETALLLIGYNDLDDLSDVSSRHEVLDSMNIRLDQLKDTILRKYDRVVFLSVIPYMDCNSNDILRESRTEFNILLKNLADFHSRISFINVVQELEDNSGCLVPAFTYDDVHLNELGYNSISRAIYEVF